MNERSDRSPAGRAAELGERMGRLAAHSLQRIERAVSEGMSGAPSTERAESAEPVAQVTEKTATPSATKRAERLLDDMGDQLNRLVNLTGPRLRMLAALAREEAEDIWAEAQHLRRTSGRDSGEAGS